MTRIVITAAAYAAIVDGRDPDSLVEALPSPTGGFYLLLDKVTLNRLEAFRGPSESYSDAIVRLASQ